MTMLLNVFEKQIQKICRNIEENLSRYEDGIQKFNSTL